MRFANVMDDARSLYRLDDMVQAPFLIAMFEHLRHELGDLFDLYSFIVYNSNDPTSMPAAAAEPGEHKILFFLTDESRHAPRHLASHFAHVFKTHLTEDRGNTIHPLNIGLPGPLTDRHPMPVRERSIDILFAGNLNANRSALYRQFNAAVRPLPPALFRQLLRVLLKLRLGALLPRDYSGTRDGLAYRVAFTGGFMQGLSATEYQALLVDSRIALCPAGFVSAESFRHSEALRAGCIVVSEPLPDTDYYRDAPFVIVRDWREGLALARAIARDPARAAELQRRGLDWYDRVLSPAGTARYVARRIRG